MLQGSLPYCCCCPPTLSALLADAGIVTGGGVSLPAIPVVTAAPACLGLAIHFAFAESVAASAMLPKMQQPVRSADSTLSS